MTPTPEQIAQAEAEEREAEAFVDAQWKAADAWLAAEWPHASYETRAAIRSVWTELAGRQGAAGVVEPHADVIRALELGRAHAKWSVDRSKDAVERRMNQHDVDRIDAALVAARGVATDGGDDADH